MYKAEKNSKIYSTKNFKLCVCKICGHTEWITMDSHMQEDYHCPFCRSPKKAFLDYGSEIFDIVINEFIHLADSVFFIKQNPSFIAPFTHNAYFIEHEKGNILFDVPAFLNKKLFKEIEKRGELKYIIHSHNHFLGASRLLCERFLAQSWLGKEDLPIKGNLNYPDYWLIKDIHTINDPTGEIVIKKFQGHTKGSYVLLIKRENGILLAGDSFYINHSEKKDSTNLFLFSKEKIESLDWLFKQKINILGCNTGAIKNAEYYINQLKTSENPYGNPTKDSINGVLIDKEDIITI